MSVKVILAMMTQFAVIALALFVPAGTLNWPAGWMFLVLLTGFIIAVARLLARHNPELLEERASFFRANQKGWDKVFLALYTFGGIAWLIVMALDAVRFSWSHVPVWLQGGSVIGLILSFSIIYLAFQENAYLSSVVRIQEDRGQTVVMTGPYRYVRHPMYAGLLILFPATAVVLGSWYGFLLALVLDGMFAVRAVLEERMLWEELNGYEAYTAKVKYRFIPYVW